MFIVGKDNKRRKTHTHEFVLRDAKGEEGGGVEEEGSAKMML